jgi:hypothetical protein
METTTPLDTTAPQRNATDGLVASVNLALGVATRFQICQEVEDFVATQSIQQSVRHHGYLARLNSYDVVAIDVGEVARIHHVRRDHQCTSIQIGYATDNGLLFGLENGGFVLITDLFAGFNNRGEHIPSAESLRGSSQIGSLNTTLTGETMALVALSDGK